MRSSFTRALFALVVALVAVAPGARSAHATADGPDYFAVSGVAAGSVLNIRAAPSTSGAKLGTIRHDGRHLRNLGCQGGPTYAEWERMSAADRARARFQRWCKVRYRGIEGWVAGWFLTEDGAP